jgi:hypothetical protein
MAGAYELAHQKSKEQVLLFGCCCLVGCQHWSYVQVIIMGLSVAKQDRQYSDTTASAPVQHLLHIAAIIHGLLQDL